MTLYCAECLALPETGPDKDTAAVTVMGGVAVCDEHRQQFIVLIEDAKRQARTDALRQGLKLS